MIHLAAPLWLALLPLPLLVWRLLPAYRTTVPAVRAPFFGDLVSLTGQEPQHGAVVLQRRLLRGVLLALLWLCTVLALANPVARGAPQTLTRSARDTLLAVDLSGSMRTRDFAGPDGLQSRLDGVKQVLDDFVAKREGDRLGVLVFGAAPFVQVPFTPDLALVRTLVDETEPGMAGDQTVLGDAIGLAIRVFERSEAKDRILLLLTDGNDTGSLVPPRKAASIAAQRGVTVYVVGVGDPTAVGEQRLDEAVLKDIAATTGGQYFFAADAEGLRAIYDELDQLEPVQFASQTWQPERTLFQWPLGAATVLMLLFVAGNLWRLR